MGLYNTPNNGALSGNEVDNTLENVAYEMAYGMNPKNFQEKLSSALTPDYEYAEEAPQQGVLFDTSGWKDMYSDSFPPPSKQQLMSPSQEKQVPPNQPVRGQNILGVSNPVQDVQNANQTGVVVDPVNEHLKRQVANKMAGVGDPITGNMPTPPKMDTSKSYTEQLSEAGKQISLDQSKIPAWNESESFNYALVTFGLNLLSGNDLGQSFGLASKSFMDNYGLEKRMMWADDLRKDGYDETEIQTWIQTGDSKDLTNPFDKKMKLQQFNLGQAQLDNALYENDPKMRKYKQDIDVYDREFRVKTHNDSIAMQKAQMAQSASQHAEYLALQREKFGAASKAGIDPETGLPLRMTEADKKNLNNYNVGKNAMQVLSKYNREGNIYHANPNNPMEAKVVDMVLRSDSPIALASMRAMNKDWDRLARTVELTKPVFSSVLYGQTGAQISATEWFTQMGKMSKSSDSQEISKQKDTGNILDQLSLHPIYGKQMGNFRSNVDYAFQDPETSTYIVVTKDGNTLSFD